MEYVVNIITLELLFIKRKWRLSVSLTGITIRGDRVLIAANEGDDTSSGGIIIPDTAKEKPMKGTVVLVGSGEKNDSGNLITIDDIAVGDTVYYTKWGGTEITFSGDKYLLVKSQDIVAIEKK